MAGDFLFSGQPSPDVTTSSVVAQGQPEFWLDYVRALMSKGSAIAGSDYQPFTGEVVAPRNATQQQAANMTQQNVGAWQPLMSQGNDLMSQGANASGYGAGAPSVQAGIGMSGYDAGSPFVTSAGQTSGIGAAQPYMDAASQATPDVISRYMSPYMSNVTDRIAQLGSRNLTENLLPNIGDQFIKAGQFGGSREGEFASRALRDTQDSILGQQSQALQQGYGQAENAANADLSRIAGIGSTVGSLTGADAARQLQAGTSLASMTNEDAARSMTGGMDLSQLVGSDAARQLQGGAALSTNALNTQAAGIKDAAGVGAVGDQERQIQQQQDTAGQNQFLEERGYPEQQAYFMNQLIRGINPPTTTTTNTTAPASASQMTQSPLTQLASLGVGAYGLSQMFKRGGRVARGIGGGAPRPAAERFARGGSRRFPTLQPQGLTYRRGINMVG